MRIGKPHLYKKDGWTYIASDVELNGKIKELFFAVEEEYSSYLVDDRIDAFVVALMTIAMKHGEDIISDTPMTRRLKYQLEHYLIPSMAANMEIYNRVSILCPVADTSLDSKGAVATGWTGGVDSMYTLYKHTSTASLYPLTHLLIANNGAIESTRDTFLYMINKARRGIATELGLKVIGVDSNIQDFEDEKYLAVAVFRLSAVALALQKLIGVFLSSGAYEINKFSFDQDNCFYYEVLPLSMFFTDTTSFHSAYGAVKRFDKIKELSEYDVAKRYLHPCVYAKREDNCTKCSKCRRTAGALFVLGKLDEFRAVFDVDGYNKNWEQLLAMDSRNEHVREIYSYMEETGFKVSSEFKREVRIKTAAHRIILKNKELIGDSKS